MNKIRNFSFVFFSIGLLFFFLFVQIVAKMNVEVTSWIGLTLGFCALAPLIAAGILYTEQYKYKRNLRFWIIRSACLFYGIGFIMVVLQKLFL